MEAPLRVYVLTSLKEGVVVIAPGSATVDQLAERIRERTGVKPTKLAILKNGIAFELDFQDVLSAVVCDREVVHAFCSAQSLALTRET